MLRKWRIRKSLAGLPEELKAGLALIIAAFAAVVFANSPAAGIYHDLFHHALPWSPLARLGTLHAWINDGLMAVFFFTVGLEIKREVVDGELSSPQRRRLPVIAAFCGMAVPAAIYLAVAGTGAPLGQGWAIPAATDIAFALGVLALLGPAVPRELRLLLLTIAIVDDIGAVAVIAVFYGHGLAAAWLLAAGAILAAMIALNLAGVQRRWPYVALAILLWLAVLQSEIHATVAGVLAAFTIPLKLDRHGDSPLLRLEHAMVWPVAFVVVPLFGFANAGVALTLGTGGEPALPLAIAAGLFIGKQAGIFGSIVLACRTGYVRLPAGTGWLQLWGMALLCGIGFTMSLFISGLAFPGHPELAEQAKLGILGGSLLSAIAGFAVLKYSATRTRH